MAGKLYRRPAVLNWLKIVIASAGDECVPWFGQTDRDGYGNVHWLIDGISKRYLIHRVMLSMISQPEPEKPYCLHSCHNPTCCNPRHLRWGTALENNQERDLADRGRKSRVSHEDVERLRHVTGQELKALAKEIGVCWNHAYFLRNQAQS